MDSNMSMMLQCCERKRYQFETRHGLVLRPSVAFDPDAAILLVTIKVLLAVSSSCG